MIPGEYVHTFGDVHIYDNHKEAVETQLQRTPKQLPKLVMNVGDDAWKWATSLYEFDNGFAPEKFTLENYNPDPFIKAELSTGLIK